MKYRLSILLLLNVILTLGASAEILYRISGNGLKESSYLFGTHHLAPLSVIDSTQARAAFNSASQIVGEIDMTQDKTAMALQMQMHLMAPADSTLTKVLGIEKMNLYSQLFKLYSPIPGMELQMLDAMKPMVINSMITLHQIQKAMPGHKEGEQLDAYFQIEAKKNGKEIIALETAEQQAAFLYDSVSISDQAKSLCHSFDNPDEIAEMIKTLNTAYMSGDLETLYSLTKSEDVNPQFFDILLYGRNDEWMKKLPSIISRGSTFIAVGALHLAGKRGLVEQFRELGYTVTPLK